MATPENRTIALDPTGERAEHRKLVIVGSGPAGFTAALYAARAELDVLVLRGPEPGGQLTLTPDIENYPGFPDGLTGFELMDKMEAQAKRFGAEVRYGEVSDLDLTRRPYRMVVDGETEISADAVILSTGASARYLGLANERRLLGKGVSACATCDGAFFRDVELAVVGGGDTAMEEALFLTRFATKVTVIHRRDEFRASKILQQRVFAHPKIEVLWNHRVEDILGEERVDGLALEDTQTGSKQQLPVGGVFIAIGHQPNTNLVRDTLALDAAGYLLTEPGSTRTSLPGVFACGDVQDSIYRQAITAAGTGAMAALDAERWLAEQGAEANQETTEPAIGRLEEMAVSAA
ncbi:MAG: thioredoxin-disulfide reductase [Deltaproteobacteria bacterium]|nr:thioredoxin-disulfide reductase [Deltaproteobacteria bacterium]